MAWRKAQLRLPPQPTNTALARLVRRLVDRFPGVSIGRHASLEADHSRVSLALDRLRREHEALLGGYAALADELKAMMVSFSPSIYSVYADREYRDHSMEWITRVRVEFSQLDVAIITQFWAFKSLDKVEPHEMTIELLRRLSLELAHAHTKELATKILEISLMKLNRQDRRQQCQPTPPTPPTM